MKKIFFSAMMLAALASCSKNENSGEPDAGSTPEIMLSGKALSVETKAAYTETAPSVTAPMKALVIGSTVTSDYTTANQYVAGTMTFTGTAVGFDATGLTGTKTYPVAKAPVYMTGFYPDQGWTNAGTGTNSFTFTGVEDVMFADQIETTSDDVAQSGSPKSFTFKHQLSMLEVKVVVDGDQTLADTWGVLKDLKLIGQFNSKATVTMQAANTIAFDTPATDWKFYTDADVEFTAQSFALPLSGKAAGAAEADLLAAAQVAASTMLAPLTAVAATPSYKLAITTGVNGDATKDVLTNVDLTLKKTDGADFEGDTKGYKFSVVLIFKAKTTIYATATVEAWKDGGTTIAPIE